jgi:hypothetical protein
MDELQLQTLLKSMIMLQGPPIGDQEVIEVSCSECLVYIRNSKHCDLSRVRALNGDTQRKMKR